MKVLFWFLGLFGAAAALALLMGQNHAMVTLFWAPHRVDVSFNLALCVLLLLMVVVHVSLRSIAALKELPSKARLWRQTHLERTAHQAYVNALIQLMAGRYVKARGLARQAVDAFHLLDSDESKKVEWWIMSHMLAAEASHALQDTEAKTAHLQSVEIGLQHMDDGVLREAVALKILQWAVDGGHIHHAQQLFKQLPGGAMRRTLALRLRLKLSQYTEDHATALETARLLAKHGAFSADSAVSILRKLRVAQLEECHDLDQLRAWWKRLDAKDRRVTSVVVPALQRLHALMPQNPEDPKAIWTTIQHWVEPFLQHYEGLPEDERCAFVSILHRMTHWSDSEWLSTAEALHQRFPGDAGAAFLAAQVFFEQKLWGKATVAFQQAIRNMNDAYLLCQSWQRLAQLAEVRGDTAAALQAWRTSAEMALGRHPHPRTAL